MNRARLVLVLLVLGATAATAPAQYYPGYPGYGPQPPMNGAFPAYGMPVNPAPIMPNTMVSSGAFIATPPPAANGFSTPPSPNDAVGEPPYIPRVWGSIDYLLLWVKRAPMPVPIITTGRDSDPVPGAIGQPGTMVLEGGGHTDFGSLAGARASVGMWLGYDRMVGIEGSAFATQNAIKRFSVGSDAAGNPPLFFPFFDNNIPGESARVISDPAFGSTGAASVTSTLELRGAEVNGVLCCGRSENCEFDLLGGVRYLRLAESLNVGAESTNAAFDATVSTFDGFGTRNEFYGGQLGGRLSFRGERMSLDTTLKCAVGPTYETVNVTGLTNVVQASTGLPLGTASGGAFTAASNIRNESHNRISVVPELETKLGFNLTGNLTLFASYNFLYWTDVVRPGDQMDHVQSPAPSAIFKRSDFWAQGVTFGLELKF